MNIEYKNDKKLKIYRDYVCNPSPESLRMFRKHFNNINADSVLKLHNRLCSYENIAIYNTVFQGKNSIQQMEGVNDNDNFILKVRVDGDWRKFFNCFCEEHNLLKKKDFKGQYNEICSIYVTDVNKHNYNK